jgi:3-isopropylmalate/(R)-2-methylmalate dehydratase small subunit
MILRGIVWKFGDFVHSNVFLAGRHDAMMVKGRYEGYDSLVPHLLEEHDPNFVRNFKRGDLIVAGLAFGGGKHISGLVGTLKLLGIGGIVAKSFYYEWERVSTEAGVPALVCDEIQDQVSSGEEMQYDLDNSTVSNLTRSSTFRVAPTPAGIVDILKAGGLGPYTLNRLASASRGDSPK